MSTRELAQTWHGLVAGETRGGNSGRAVVVAEVQSGSPAETAGFRAGDHVVKVGDLAVASALDIERGLLDVPAGRPTRVVIRREGQEQALDLELRSLTGQPVPRVTLTSATVDAGEQVYRLLGLKTQAVTPEYVASASSKLRGGLYVQAVAPGSVASRALIQKGDILVGMNVGMRHWETIRPDNVLFILRQPEVPQAQTLYFYIVRRNIIHQGSMNLAEIPTTAAVTR
jgi:serine protease Do